jgi:hypothetical protein
MKNRRTAEESRQRRLHKLQNLEKQAIAEGQRCEMFSAEVAMLKASIEDVHAGGSGGPQTESDMTIRTLKAVIVERDIEISSLRAQVTSISKAGKA